MNQKQLKVFFPNLDGLRFFCFLAVFFFHSFATNYDYIKDTTIYKFVKYGVFGNGNLGVNFFFVLSGFLITYLLLAEKKNYGNINIPGFYMRRVLRIWPMFFFCVFFGFYVFPVLKQLNHETPQETAHILSYLTFLNNFDFIKYGRPDASMLGVLWSVAIEEQFYLVWPILLVVIKPRYYGLLFGLLIAASFIFRYWNAHHPIILEHHTFSCISDLAVGGLGAFLVFNYQRVVQFIQKAPKSFWIIIYCLLIIVFFARKYIFQGTPFIIASDRVVIAVIFVLIILEQCFAGNALYQMKNYSLPTRLGIYTYGLYCLHFFSILIIAKLLQRLGWNKHFYQVLIVEPILSLLIAIFIAKISYKYYETPFLKLKTRFAKIIK